MSSSGIGLASPGTTLRGGPSSNTPEFLMYWWSNGDFYRYCKTKTKQTLRLQKITAKNKATFILDRNDPDVTKLTVELDGEQIAFYESLEEMGLPHGMALCPYAYVGKRDDKFHLVHTSLARRSVAVGDSSLAMLIKGCPRLLQTAFF